jgi:hypothetical protein
MKKRPIVQRTSARKQVLRRRRIHTSFGGTWERLRLEARRLGTLAEPSGASELGSQARPA